MESIVSTTKTLKTPMGRLRIFLDRLDDTTFRSAYAFLPQSTIGDIINRAFYMAELGLDPDLDNNLPILQRICPKHQIQGFFPVLQVHDEIVYECRVGDVHQAVQLVKRWMTCPLEIKGVKEPLVIPLDIEIGKNWWDVKEYDENEDYGYLCRGERE